MNQKKVIFIVILLMMSSIVQIPISIEASGSTNTVVDIRVAVHHANDYIITGTDDHFDQALSDYNWTIGNISYVFDVTTTDLDDLGYPGRLDNYQVFIDAGGQDEHMWCAYPFLPCSTRFPFTIKPYNGQDIKENLEQYIRNGGAYIGTCGGSSFPVELDRQYITRAEKIYNDDAFVDIPVKFHSVKGYQFIDEWSYYDPNTHRFHLCIFPWNEDPDPTRLGAWAYLFFSGFSTANYTSFGGASLDLNIRKPDHAIFKDYLQNSVRVRWAGGPAFTIEPGHPEIERLADFPVVCLENNESIALHAWSWNDPGIDMIHVLIEMFRDFATGDFEHLTQAFPTLNYFDWDPTSRLLITDLESRPVMVVVPYYNGKLLLSGVHPESGMWYDGHIEEEDESNDNTLFNGLYKWTNDTTGEPLNKNTDMIWDQNYWLCRRETAYMSGLVPDSHLPPVYGRSQVVDIEPELQEEDEFTIDCCVGKEKNEDWDTINLSLWYRYNDSGSWTEWTYYDSITSMPYQFTFDACVVSSL